MERGFWVEKELDCRFPDAGSAGLHLSILVSTITSCVSFVAKMLRRREG
jgi:hypothetical protein